MAARLAHNQEVGGSSPLSATRRFDVMAAFRGEVSDVILAYHRLCRFDSCNRNPLKLVGIVGVSITTNTTDCKRK